MLNTIELQCLEQAGSMVISASQRQFQPSRVSFYINLNSRDPSPIYETSMVRDLLLVDNVVIKTVWPHV